MSAHARSKDQGVALVLVIWLVTLLMVIAGSFLYASRTDATAMRNAALLARGDALISAAVSRAMLELQKPVNAPGVWRREPIAREWTFEGAAFSITLRDESGKIDINFANDALISGLLRQGGMGDEQAARLVEAMKDWRDADSLTRPNGAEGAEYQAAGLSYGPANQPFASIEELQLVLGMSRQVFDRIAPDLTVYSRLPGINPHFASRNALMAIPGMGPDQVDPFLEQRASASAEGRPLPALPAAGAFASYSNTPATAIQVDVKLPDGPSIRRDIVATSTPQFPRRPLAVLAWREGVREAGSGAVPTRPSGEGK